MNATIRRREALTLLLSAVAASQARCTPPQEEIVPYVGMPEQLVPGEPMRFATALPLSGYGRGAIGICMDGRPIKIEGNDRHPYSLGATDVFGEAEVLSLYDPDRSRTPLHDGIIASWREFSDAWTRWAQNQTASRGKGIGLVTGRITSRAVLRGIRTFKQRFPELRHYRYEAVHDDAARAGARLAFGRNLCALPRLADADVLVTLDADPLGPSPAFVAQARAFAARRFGGKSLRIHAVESGWTLTGAVADRRLAMHPARIGEISRAIAAGFGLDLGTPDLSDAEAEFARAATADLKAGRGLILAGETQLPAIHALTHWLNAQSNAPVELVPPVDPEEEDHGAAFSALETDLGAKALHTLIVLGANPVYDTPKSEAMSAAIASLPFSVHCGLHRDETAEHCRWHLPLSHVLESWGDIRSPDGTAALIQPLIRPLYNTLTPEEILNLLAGGATFSPRDLVRSAWAEDHPADFDAWWNAALEAGLIAGSRSEALTLTPRKPEMLADRNPDAGLVLTVLPSASVWDGRYANNAWLQECPAPFTKEVWGNAVHVSPEDAAALNLQTGDGMTLRNGTADIAAVVAVLNGHPKGVLGATLGYGRWRGGVIANGIGCRVAALREGLAAMADGVTMTASGERNRLRSTQTHTRLEGEDAEIYPLAPLSNIAETIARRKPEKHGVVPPLPANNYAWAMVIDNDLCIGCNACVVACQAENNVAVVGPDEIGAGRDMHWLRIDTYEIESHILGEATPRRGFQPVPCMHCETAPCEPVCPVAASVHDHEGLNVQVYNRCIGTRFCEANCPYKVRRFNYFGYSRGQEYGNLGQAPVGAQHNPNVSVRGRGVMEKCTYCVQRISKARRQAEKESRLIAKGEVVTACQAACPTHAIHFGNRNDAATDVARLQSHDRHYALLGHLDTRPRTTYLAKTFNEIPLAL